MDLRLVLLMIVILLESPQGSSSQSPSGPMQGETSPSPPFTSAVLVCDVIMSC